VKPSKYFFATDLLDYFVGTTSEEIWQKRTEIRNWLKDNFVLVGKNSVCQLSDCPHDYLPEYTENVKSFVSQAIAEFGTHDYEISPLQPCGGWKYLNIIIN
jgi:hypothetical protein